MAKINFNEPPYYDDYVPSKRFQKILFKPAVAVQARELNQFQSIYTGISPDMYNNTWAASRSWFQNMWMSAKVYFPTNIANKTFPLELFRSSGYAEI